MFSSRIPFRRATKDEAEKPFWISYADLMTALMVMFLLVMSVALLAVTKKVNEHQVRVAARQRDIKLLLDQLAKAAHEYPGVTVDEEAKVIDFGDKARFGTNSFALTAPEASFLRNFVGNKVLPIARRPLAKKWLKRIVVEGFTDQRGTYLYNLNLSLERAQNVLCALLAPPVDGEQPMAASDLEQIRTLFLVGGYSFNSAKKSLEASRRIELRLEFFGLDEPRPPAPDIPPGNFGHCALG